MHLFIKLGKLRMEAQQLDIISLPETRQLSIMSLLETPELSLECFVQLIHFPCQLTMLLLLQDAVVETSIINNMSDTSNPPKISDCRAVFGRKLWRGQWPLSG